MCGVAGSWSSFDYDNEAIATNMADQIVSRGPDDVGVWTDINDGLAMAHRRLGGGSRSSTPRGPGRCIRRRKRSGCRRPVGCPAITRRAHAKLPWSVRTSRVSSTQQIAQQARFCTHSES